MRWSDYDEAATIASDDDILFRDVSDTTLGSTGTQKRIKKSNLVGDFGSITSGKLIKADANGLPEEATNSDSEVSDAVAKKHAQNTDTGTSASEFYVDTGGANVAVKAHIQDTNNPHGTTLVQDTSPQLGGDLDLNGHAIDFPTTPNISDCLDEDDMASNSAVALATQQSIKAYVDSLKVKTLTSKYGASSTTATSWTDYGSAASLDVGTSPRTVIARWDVVNVSHTTAGEHLYMRVLLNGGGTYNLSDYKTQGGDGGNTSGVCVMNSVTGTVSAQLQWYTTAGTAYCDGITLTIEAFAE